MIIGRTNRTRSAARVRDASIRGTFSPVSIAADVFVVLLGLSGSFIVKLIGDMPLAQIILIPAVPILLAVRPSKVFRRDFRLLYTLLGLWLFGLILTDIYRGTVSADWLRGDAKLAFFFMSIAGIAALLAGNDRRKLLFQVSGVIGLFLSIRLQPTEYMQLDPWKWGYSGVVTGAVLLLCVPFFSRRNYLVVTLLFLGLVGINLLFNFRSPVLTLMVALVLVVPVVPERIGRLRLLPDINSSLRIVVLGVWALAASLAAMGIVSYATALGFAGEEAQEKNKAQSSTKGGLLLGGRPEILVSSRAVMDSPILGHGSWAKDQKYVDMMFELQGEFGIKQNVEAVDQGVPLIPTHSHLMGAWVEAGLAGAIFWFYILGLVFRGTIRMVIQKPPLSPVYVYGSISLIWAIWASPFGPGELLGLAFLLIVHLDILNESKPPAEPQLRTGRMARFRYRLETPGSRLAQSLFENSH